MTAIHVGRCAAGLQYLDAAGMRKTNPITDRANRGVGSIHMNILTAARLVPHAAAMVQEHREEALPMLSRGFCTCENAKKKSLNHKSRAKYSRAKYVSRRVRICNVRGFEGCLCDVYG